MRGHYDLTSLCLTMQQRRADKKATKMVFKAEALKQEKLHLNNLTRRAPVV